MPTNLIGNRTRPNPAPNSARRTIQGERFAVIAVGGRQAEIRLLETPTADRIWAALPIFSIAETWGDSIHFEVPIESGRERGAKLNGAPSELYYWSDDDRILFAFGPTPISRPNEVRLPRPCNVWALAIDDLAIFRGLQPGLKISLQKADRDQ